MSKNLITPEQLLAHDFQPNPMFVVRDGLPGGPEPCEAIQEKLNNLGVAISHQGWPRLFTARLPLSLLWPSTASKISREVGAVASSGSLFLKKLASAS
jgi:hypothetical protein